MTFSETIFLLSPLCGVAMHLDSSVPLPQLMLWLRPWLGVWIDWETQSVTIRGLPTGGWALGPAVFWLHNYPTYTFVEVTENRERVINLYNFDATSFHNRHSLNAFLSTVFWWMKSPVSLYKKNLFFHIPYMSWKTIVKHCSNVRFYLTQAWFNFHWILIQV